MRTSWRPQGICSRLEEVFRRCSDVLCPLGPVFQVHHAMLISQYSGVEFLSGLVMQEDSFLTRHNHGISIQFVVCDERENCLFTVRRSVDRILNISLNTCSQKIKLLMSRALYLNWIRCIKIRSNVFHCQAFWSTKTLCKSRVVLFTCRLLHCVNI